MIKLPLKTYLNLCTQVYDLSKPKPPEEAYAFYRLYACEVKGAVLEPMCGTGRFLLPLLEEGFDIRGFDASPHMLNALHAKAKQRNLSPKVWQEFIEEFQQPEQYNLIFIPDGTFGLISELNAAMAALKKLYEHLCVGGLLVFEIETPSSIPNEFNIWKASAWTREDGKVIISNSLALPPVENVLRWIYKYELVAKNQIIQTEVENYEIRLYESKVMIKMLKDIGFRSVKPVKAFNLFSSPEKNDSVIVFECKK